VANPERPVLLIAGSIRIDPTQRDELIGAAIEVARELRKQIGCTHVAISADLEDRGQLYLFQKWESQAALTANISSARIYAIRNQVGKLGIRDMALLKYEVEAIEPL
jgi:quinol monooxygenase YgiN